MKEKRIEILTGWRLKLFNKVIENGLFEIKNGKFIATDKMMELINKRTKTRKKKNATRKKKKKRMQA